MKADQYQGQDKDALRRDHDLLVSILKGAGAKYQGDSKVTCPFHEDRHPSGSVFTKAGVWRFACHSGNCGWSGDVIDLMARLDNVSVGDVLNCLKGQTKASGSPSVADLKSCHTKAPSKDKIWTGQDIKTWAPEREVYKYAKDGKAYFKIRRITPAGQKDQHLPFSPTEGGYITRWTMPKPWTLYGLEQLNGAKDVLIVEGERCADRVRDLGVITCTTSSGGSKSGQHTDWTPLRGRRVTIWPDADDAGHAHAKTVSDILLGLGSEVFMIDPAKIGLTGEGDDVVQYLEKHPGDPASAVIAALDTATKAGDALTEFNSYFNQIAAGTYRRIDWPNCPLLSKLTQSFLPGMISLLYGHGGSGKSLFTLQALIGWHRAGVPVGVFEVENGRPYHLRRALAQLTGNQAWTDIDRIRQESDVFATQVQKHSEFLRTFGAAMTGLAGDSEVELSIVAEWIEHQVRAGKRLVCIDPVTLCKKGRTGDPVWTVDEDFLRAAEKSIRSTGSSLLLISHPTKDSRGGIVDVAGGAVYRRLPKYVLHLLSAPRDKPFKSVVKDRTTGLKIEETHSHVIHIEKCSDGEGDRCKIAYNLDIDRGLVFNEIGLILESVKHG